MQLDFNQGNTIYVIDTSALIRLEYTFKYDNPVFVAIWEEIEDMIGQESFITIDFVENEINSYEGKEDFLQNWIKKWKKLLVVPT
jgi:citrate lyase synthetase